MAEKSKANGPKRKPFYTRCTKCHCRFPARPDHLPEIPDQIVGRLIEVFGGDPHKINTYWFRPNHALGGKSPAEAWKEGPRQLIFDGLGRIEHGIIT